MDNKQPAFSDLIQGTSPTDTLIKAMNKVERMHSCMVLVWYDDGTWEVMPSEMGVSDASLLIDVAKDMVLDQVRRKHHGES